MGETLFEEKTEMGDVAVRDTKAGQVAEMHDRPDQSQLLAVIAQAASNPQIDVTKLERLMDLYERAEKREAEKHFNEAMSGAQSEIRPIAADANNPQTRSKYASYAQLDKALRPIYTKHGFALSFDTAIDAPESYVGVLCYVSHNAGFSRTYRVNMPADGKGAKGGDVMTKTHAVGSAMSYGSRYLLKLIFNVAVGEDDDDGNRAGDGNEKVNAEQLQNIRDLIERTGSDVERLCKYFGVEALPEIRSKDYQRVIAALNLKEKKIQ
jgi:hypothetical protein